MRIKLLLVVVGLVFSLQSFAWYFKINNTTSVGLSIVKQANSCFGNVEERITLSAQQVSKVYYVELKSCSEAKLAYSVYRQTQPGIAKGYIFYKESRSWLAMLGLGHSKPDGEIAGNNIAGTVSVQDNIVTFTIRQLK